MSTSRCWPWCPRSCEARSSRPSCSTTSSYTGGSCPRRPARRSTSSRSPGRTSTTCSPTERRPCRRPRPRASDRVRAEDLAEQVAGDDEPLDLVGALEDLGHLGLPHVALDREVAGVAVAAEHLDGAGRAPHRG